MDHTECQVLVKKNNQNQIKKVNHVLRPSSVKNTVVPLPLFLVLVAEVKKAQATQWPLNLFPPKESEGSCVKVIIKSMPLGHTGVESHQNLPAVPYGLSRPNLYW